VTWQDLLNPEVLFHKIPPQAAWSFGTRINRIRRDKTLPLQVLLYSLMYSDWLTFGRRSTINWQLAKKFL
jgi:hypothetical protein